MGSSGEVDSRAGAGGNPVNVQASTTHFYCWVFLFFLNKAFVLLDLPGKGLVSVLAAGSKITGRARAQS